MDIPPPGGCYRRKKAEPKGPSQARRFNDNVASFETVKRPDCFLRLSANQMLAVERAICIWNRKKLGEKNWTIVNSWRKFRAEVLRSGLVSVEGEKIITKPGTFKLPMNLEMARLIHRACVDVKQMNVFISQHLDTAIEALYNCSVSAHPKNAKKS